MAQVNRVTSGIKGVGGVASLQSLITTLQNNMALNKDITASDVNQLISAYNSWQDHHHTTDDLIGIDSEGNLAVYGAGGTYTGVKNASDAKNTGGTLFTTQPLIVVAAIAGVNEPDGDIEDNDVNAIINSINAIRDHLHTIDDITS